MIERNLGASQLGQDMVAGGATSEYGVPVENGIWPSEYFNALLAPVAEWALQHPTQYHHVGFTYPNQSAFEAAIGENAENVISNNLVTPSVTHQRRYLRLPGETGQDTFVEYHMVGENGNGVEGIHFDFITGDPEGMLNHIVSTIDTEALNGAKVVTQSFGGGNAPVGKVGLQLPDNPKIEVGVMARTHYSDPVTW